MKNWKNSILGHELVDPASLLANEMNWRVHPKQQQDIIDEALDRVGFVRDILVNIRDSEEWGNRRGIPTVLDGHLRAKRAISTGQREVPVSYVNLSPEDEAYVLATLDPIAGLAAVDRDMLSGLMSTVPDIDPHTKEMLDEIVGSLHRDDDAGYSGSDGESGTTDDSFKNVPDADELRQSWGVEVGDIWLMPARKGGSHFLIVGDSGSQEVSDQISALDVSIKGSFTSPPYADRRSEHYDSVAEDEFVDWFEPIQGLVERFLDEKGSFIVNVNNFSRDNTRTLYVEELAVAMVKRWGWKYKDKFAWLRPGIPGDPNHMGKFKSRWEPVYWWSRDLRPYFQPDRVMHESDGVYLDDKYRSGLSSTQGNASLVGVDREMGSGMAYPGNVLPAYVPKRGWGHPAAFPEELPLFFIKAYSDPGDFWLDMFAGSGSTMIACEESGRQSVSVELSPQYAALILQRYQETYNIKAEKYE